MNIEVSDLDKAGMIVGFDIDLDYALYTKESREGHKKGKSRRRRDDKEYKRKRRNLNSNMSQRDKNDSMFRGSGSSWAGGNKGTSSNWRREDKDVSSRQSKMRSHNNS